jgi:hypothetical protein
MKKKITLAASFAAATLLVAGQFTLADQNENNTNDMMNNDGMMKMMENMNTPEGQKMMESCMEFMDSSSKE